jgi:dihydrofolate synthase / folylpolyglutamate synthase
VSWSYQRAEDHLLGLELFGMRFGLERMRRLMTALGSPQRAFRAVHVVGTNGKSSTVRMTAALLEAHGVRTGSYLSPHLSSFAERIRIGDADLDTFGAAIERAAAAAAKVNRGADEPVTQFELLTAAAFAEFAAREVQVAVVEAGLGGRYDATNVLDAEVVVLTNVGLEHTRWLGPTVEDIAREKLAVVGPDSTLIDGRKKGSDPFFRSALGARGCHPLAPLRGYQAENFALAAEAAEAMIGPLDAGRVAEVARTISVPGRMHWLAGDVLLDGAHNPSGVQALVRSLPFEEPPVLVASILDDKDAADMLRHLVPAVAGAVFTRSANPRALSPATLASLWEQLGGGEARIEPDPRAAVQLAREDGRGVLVTGSIYLVGDLVSDPGRRRASAL